MITYDILIQFITEYKNKFPIFKDDKNKNKINTYHDECIEYLKKKKEKKDNIRKIKKENKILDILRLYLLNSNTTYKLYISDKKIENSSYIKYTFTRKELENLIILLSISELYDSDIMEFKNIDTNRKIKIIDKINDTNILYLNINDKTNNINNKYDSLGLLLSIESLNILKYQRLDRIRDFTKDNTTESYKIFDYLNKYRLFVRNLNNIDRELIIIMSGAIFQALGTTYTRDIDVIYLKNEKIENIQIIGKEIKEKLECIDLSILRDDLNYYAIDEHECYQYKRTWLNYVAPSLVGAKDIFELIYNSCYHFYFMGIKFTGIEFNIQRILTRANYSSIADLIMFVEINNYKMKCSICLPNLTVRQGGLIVFDGEYLTFYYKRLQESLLKFYGVSKTIDELKQLVKRCTCMNIYKGIEISDPDVSIIKLFHILIKKQMFFEHAYNINNLLEIGAGRLTDMSSWNNANIKNVVAIEPSKESIQHARNRMNKYGYSSGTIQLINGKGDEIWKHNDNYKIVYKYKYDVVSFQFCIHYMFNNLQIVLNNIKDVIKPKTRILITCMNGNKINKELQYKKIIEIRNNNEPIFAVIPKYKVKPTIDNNSDILVYIKGGYGVASGSIEPIIDIKKMIDIFLHNKYKLIQFKPFLGFDIPVKYKMSNIQKQVSSYYVLVVFEYNG